MINSHQPLEGPLAWYEAHIQSDEGINIMGGFKIFRNGRYQTS